ncbi:16S rRNA (guanine(527)-N(7))-methyltransferase RsmG [Marinigracilibium pacificum]|uniref:Ribosomal RNA small subunit methyltransferase G n=1 Tax=Marinigracilibium pacificum TaxID=2729599 RepID=A0A848J198_9BACT|nr:16S rRNA (guanine(527)-N(7))-methyltransferase RsmG [Marinigracilibium pacificum]NMM49128.1 16S rRNA (guanine(527)-N(7))-methyltransferase RsmG [Marinigracilibium pacificum]
MSDLFLINKYFQELTELQQSQYKKALDTYREWNQKINVISRKDIENLEEKHFLHSLAIAKVIKFDNGTKIMDVGTGGGFPGIPLAIMFPEVKFHLVDSIAKKIKVVEEVVNATGIKNVTYEHARAEKVKGKFDYVISRAVTRMKPFYSWIQNKIEPGPHKDVDHGIIYLKGGDISEEMDELNKSYQEFNISDMYTEPFFETKKVVHVPF